MKFFLFCFVVFISRWVNINGISTYYMDQLCGQSLYMGNSYDYSIRLKLTSRYSYRPNMNCSLTLNTIISHKLMFVFKDMRIESSSSCRRDWLEIHDGGSRSSRFISGLSQRQCGYYTPSGSYHSTGNQLTLFFVSDSSISDKGFDMVITRYHTGSCYSYEYSCSNGRCIDDSLTCNGYNPCGDYSDCPLAAGAIAGIVLGSMCVLVVVTVFIVCRWRRRRFARHKEIVVTNTTTYGTPGVGYNQPVPQQYPAPTPYPTGNQPPPPAYPTGNQPVPPAYPTGNPPPSAAYQTGNQPPPPYPN